MNLPMAYVDKHIRYLYTLLNVRINQALQNPGLHPIVGYFGSVTCRSMTTSKSSPPTVCKFIYSVRKSAILEFVLGRPTPLSIIPFAQGALYVEII